MDIFNHTVVLAKGGMRKNYRPVSDSSVVCKTSLPMEILEFLQPREVYIADLNALQGEGPLDVNVEIIREVSLKADTMLDFGVSSLKDVDKALSIAGTAVLGTETGTLSVIRDAVSRYPGRISVSIDMKYGKILKQDSKIPEDPFEIVKLLNELPLKDLIFLDLDRVGTSSGFDPEFLRKLAESSAHDVLLAGGIRGMEDLLTLENFGIKGALVATAIHSGSVPPEVMTTGLKKVKNTD